MCKEEVPSSFFFYVFSCLEHYIETFNDHGLTRFVSQWYNLRTIWSVASNTRLAELAFPTREKGEAIKFVYLKIACWSLAILLFHVFTRVVRVKLSLLDDLVGFI